MGDELRSLIDEIERKDRVVIKDKDVILINSDMVRNKRAKVT